MVIVCATQTCAEHDTSYDWVCRPWRSHVWGNDHEPRDSEPSLPVSVFFLPITLSMYLVMMSWTVAVLTGVEDRYTSVVPYCGQRQDARLDWIE